MPAGLSGWQSHQEGNMPQSTKDTKGGKTHAKKTTHSGGAVSDKAMAKKSARSAGSPTGPMKHGEKKTTPK
jgi:hypothetical protein